MHASLSLILFTDPEALLERKLRDKERLERRSEKFKDAGPRLIPGRKTRLQISLVKEERKNKRKETIERKKRDAAAAKESRKQKQVKELPKENKLKKYEMTSLDEKRKRRSKQEFEMRKKQVSNVT